jgi:hypothetical protein
MFNLSKENFRISKSISRWAFCACFLFRCYFFRQSLVPFAATRNGFTIFYPVKMFFAYFKSGIIYVRERWKLFLVIVILLQIQVHFFVIAPWMVRLSSPVRKRLENLLTQQVNSGSALSIRELSPTNQVSLQFGKFMLLDSYKTHHSSLLQFCLFKSWSTFVTIIYWIYKVTRRHRVYRVSKKTSRFLKWNIWDTGNRNTCSWNFAHITLGYYVTAINQLKVMYHLQGVPEKNATKLVVDITL